MAEEKDRNLEENNVEEDDIKPEENDAVDPYTGEITPPAEDAGKVDEVVPVDTGDRSGDEYLLEEETAMDYIAADEHADAVAEEQAHFTEDEQIEEVFEDRQDLAMGGRKELKEELEQHHSKSPILSGGDIDAKWEEADVSGEESVGGTTPTPDQDVVEELGEALGITYEDDEPLHTEEKLRERDRNRWELDPESADDEDNLEE
jgi:hypothetical protein